MQIGKMLPFGKKGEEKGEDKDPCKKVRDTLSRYREYRDALCKEYEDIYYGDAWKGVPEGSHRPYIPDIFRIINSELPILTDSVPGTTIKVTDPAFEEQAANLNEAVSWVQKDQDFPLMYADVVRDSLITGDGWLHVYYDANAENGDGRIMYEIIPWRNVWLSGEATTIDRISKARFKVPRSKDWLKLTYPDKADEIDKEKGEKHIDEYREKKWETRDNSGNYAKRKAPPEYFDDDILYLDCYYIKDFTTIPIPKEQTAQEMQAESEALANGESPDVNKWQDHKTHIEEQGQDLAELYAIIGLAPDAGIEAAMEAIEGILAESPDAIPEDLGIRIKLLEEHLEQHATLLEENPEGVMLKYPNAWRCVEKVGGTTVYDGENKYLHATVPIVPFYCYRTKSIYGEGQVANLIDAERMKMVIQYKEYKAHQRNINTSYLIDEESGIDENEFTNEDGQVWVVKQGTGIAPLQSNPPHPAVSAFAQDRKEDMQRISGMAEPTEGRMPGPNAAAQTVTKLDERSIGRARLKDRQNQGYSVKRVGLLTAANVIQFWPNEKVLRLENKGQESTQVVFNKIGMEDLKYEVEIAQGSMAGVDKDAFNQMAHAWLDRGQITFPELLEIGEYPKKQKIQEMVAARSDMQSQLQQLTIENLRLKASVDPKLLSPEEMQTLEQADREMRTAELTGSQ